MRLTPHEPARKCFLRTPIIGAVRQLRRASRRRAHNELTHLFGIDTQVDYEAVPRLLARWDRHASVVSTSSPRCPRPASWIRHNTDPLP
jgi:hypothetical protein